MNSIKIILIIVLVTTLALNIIKSIVILYLENKSNHKIENGEKCFFYSNGKCDNSIGKKYFISRGRCPRNDSPVCKNSNTHNILQELECNLYFKIFNYSIEYLPQISTAILVIMDITSKGE